MYRSLLCTLLFVLAAPAWAQPQTFTFTGDDQTFAVPADGSYRLAVRGADGGNTIPGGSFPGASGGSGAEVAVTFPLQAGDELTIVVGGAGGASFGSEGGGGGGGSAVIVDRGGTRTLLLVAGGAGAAGEERSGRGGVSSDGTAGGGSAGGAGGGGGFNDAGESGFDGEGGGAGTLAGGGNGGAYINTRGQGGFGFGGGGGGSSGDGGGGGGFGGGDVLLHSSGGSSFVEAAGTNGFTGTDIALADGVQGGGTSRNGEVTITTVCDPLVVTTTADSSCGSLREAITTANATPGLDTITFDIAGPGPHVIQPATQLPEITEGVVIDGTSEPDYAGTPIIELDGTNAGANASGLVITGAGSTIRGLVINRFSFFTPTGPPTTAIVIRGPAATGNTVAGNYIGTDVTGTVALGNDWGVDIRDGASNNTVGGTTAETGNVISGNQLRGVSLLGSGNTVAGNFIGTDATGTVALGNDIGVYLGGDDNTVGGTTVGARNVISGSRMGVWVEGTEATVAGNFIGTDVTGTVALGNERGVHFQFTGNGNTIGGTTAGARNVISGNTFAGIIFDISPSGQAQVAGNFIGTDVTGTVALGNGTGIVFQSHFFGGADGQTIGGTTAGARNVISGNVGDGIALFEGDRNVIAGNFIGTDATGTAALGNGRHGVSIGGFTSLRNTIGGTEAGAGNTIAFNAGPGIGSPNTPAPARNAFLGNAIFQNGGLGIDLNEDGVTANDDCGDADAGPNDLQNYPVLASATAGASTLVDYDLDTAPGDYRVEFFSVGAPDASGHGEGRTFLGAEAITVAAGCVGSFSASLPALGAGTFVTATATPVDGSTPSGFGSTSEFSAAVEVLAPDLSCPESLIISDFAVFADGNAFELRNTGTEPVSLAGCSFVATYNDVYVALDLGDGTLLPGAALGFAPSEQFRNVFGGLALLDREEVPAVGTSIAAIVDDLVASLVYLGHDVVYGFFHRNTESFEAQCLDYAPMRLHSFAQGQCAPLSRSEGPVALSHADLTEAMLAAERGATAAESDALPTAFALSSAYPNPMAERGTLTVEVPEASAVRVVVYDVLGRAVATLLDEAVEAGRYAVALDASSLAPGTYLVRLAAGGFVQTQRVTVVR